MIVRVIAKARIDRNQRAFAHHGRSCHDKRSHQAGSVFWKVNAGKRLIDLEWPRLSCLRVYMTPVVKAKRHVAVLLNLKHYDVAAQRVNRPSRDEDAIAGLRGDT